MRNTTQHDHPAEPDRALVDRFRKALTQRAAAEKTELYSIYWDEATQRHAEAALIYGFPLAESAMRKARRNKSLPQVPNSIQFPFHLECRNNNFFLINHFNLSLAIEV